VSTAAGPTQFTTQLDANIAIGVVSSQFNGPRLIRLAQMNTDEPHAPRRYHGLAAFGDDAGTLWTEPGCRGIPLTESREARLERPLVWFVDDERANREWFVANHLEHFALVTFSGRAYALQALNAGTPCDTLVTDIFFPARPPLDDAQAAELLAIYDEIDRSTVAGLAACWEKRRSAWSLDGFALARDVAEFAARRRERIPVALFSRKAPLLLSSSDWLSEPRAVENSHWVLEKVDPTTTGEDARRAARIQRDRILALVRWRNQGSGTGGSGARMPSSA
jgi:hypothetical protein